MTKTDQIHAMSLFFNDFYMVESWLTNGIKMVHKDICYVILR